MQGKSNISAKILKNLANKQAVNLKDLEEAVESKYGFRRAIKNMLELGFVEKFDSDRSSYARLTPKGRKKVASLDLDPKDALVSPIWDGKWRVVILDLPEERKSERDALRYLLKKAGFNCVKNTVWVSPHPFEHLFANIKKDLGLTTELIILVADSVDPETAKVFEKK